MNWTLIKAVLKARRNGLLKIRPADKPVRLDCLADKCAKCCMNLGSPVVTKAEAEYIDNNHLTKVKDGSCFVKSTSGTCTLLKDGLCSIYNHRPSGCTEYPWYNIDGKLYYDAGCPGIKYDKDERPDINTIQPFENFFAGVNPLALWIVKKLCVRHK